MLVKNKSLWFLFAALLLGAKAQAFLPPCQLSQVPLPANANPAFIQDYRQKLGGECSLQRRYQTAANSIASKYSASLENVTLYKALRFVDRYSYESGKSLETPVPYIYQAHKSDYNLPMSQRSNTIWLNWTTGIRQLDGWVQRRALGQPITLSELSSVHVGFYTFSDEQGDYANSPSLGQIKPPNANDRYWYKIQDSEVATTRDIVAAINSRYEAMGLLGPTDRFETDIHLPIRLRSLSDGVYVYGGDTRKNSEHLNRLFNFLNTMLAQGRQNQHMVWQGRLMTPGEVAMLAQQFFVQVHPYSDGNGRSSRFIQESVLRLFDLPYLSSGDLMSRDILTTQENYYYLSIGKTYEQFDRIEECINNVYPRLFFRSSDLKKIAPNNIEYDCRLL